MRPVQRRGPLLRRSAAVPQQLLAVAEVLRQGRRPGHPGEGAEYDSDDGDDALRGAVAPAVESVGRWGIWVESLRGKN